MRSADVNRFDEDGGVHRPPSAEGRPERRGEQAGPEGDGQGRGRRHLALADDEVDGERHRGPEGERHAERIERARPQLRHDHQSGQHETDRHPQPGLDLLLEHEEADERDEQHAGVLQQQRDPDGEAGEGAPVARLQQRDAGDAEDRQHEQLARLHPERLPVGDQQHDPGEHRCAERAEEGELLRLQPVEDEQLRGGAVGPEQGGAQQREKVPHGQPLHASSLGRGGMSLSRTRRRRRPPHSTRRVRAVVRRWRGRDSRRSVGSATKGAR